MSTNTGRRQFLQNMSAAAVAVVSSSSLTPLWASGGACPIPGPNTPYEMLVLGDSIMWGQGLLETEKYYSVVKERLGVEILHRNIRMIVRAHSGATIDPARGAFPGTEGSFPDTYGEVPITTPTLFAQASMAEHVYQYLRVPNSEVNLILLNGGINDVGFPSIINPFTTESALAANVKRSCGDRMTALLDHLASRYSNALIVVTGYYPIISDRTNRDTLSDLIEEFYGIPKGRDILRRADDEALKSRSGDWLFSRLKKLSDLWKRQSDQFFLEAVSATNAKYPAPAGCGRAVFVPVLFAPEECYNPKPEGTSALWRITGSVKDPTAPFGRRLETDDHIYRSNSRHRQCLESNLSLIDRQICGAAGTGHPNLKGSKKYSDAIIDALRGCLATA